MIPFEKSFASCEVKTPSGNLKRDYWDYEKNPKTPRMVFNSSGTKYWFKCDSCPHSFCSALNNIDMVWSWCKQELISLLTLNAKYESFPLNCATLLFWCFSNTL